MNIFLVTGPILVISAIGIYFFSSKIIKDNVHKVNNLSIKINIFIIKIIYINLKNIIVQPYSKAFEFWVNPPAKIYRKYYLFDVRNPLEVEKGLDKPFLIERGPYVYSEKWEKRNIKFFETDYVSYTPVVTLHFEESLSVGSENDTITCKIFETILI